MARRKSLGVEDADQSAAMAIERLLRQPKDTIFLHHDRGRPAPMWARSSSTSTSPTLDDLGRPRHHGLRPAGGGRRAGRPPHGLVIDIAATPRSR